MSKTFRFDLCALLDVVQVEKVILIWSVFPTECYSYIFAKENELNVDCAVIERVEPSQFEQTHEKEFSVLPKSSYLPLSKGLTVYMKSLTFSSNFWKRPLAQIGKNGST